MNALRLISVVVAVTLFAASAWALDSVRLTTGATASGKVVGMNWDKVEVEQGLGDKKTTKEYASNQVVTIFFDTGSPPVKKALLAAKTDIALKRQYAEGLKSLAKIKRDDIDDDYLKQDFDFYNALANAKLALRGEGEIREAGKAMIEFVKNNAESYHYLEACEVLGDLLVAVHSYPAAEEYYGKLAKAPWPETKMRAGVLIGRAQLAQNKFEEAHRSFQSVIDVVADGPAAEAARATALVGNASVLIGQKKTDEAIKVLNDIIAKGDSEDADLMAPAYNALGTAYRQMGDLNEAKFAFLHTDMLYSSVPDAHAEALANLSEIWRQLNKPERAAEAKKRLGELYKNSRWAKGEGKQ
jgi:tetratricopeptide (TPR) repeat protein